LREDKMLLRVDRSVCIGSGNCVRLASAIFDQDEDEGLVVLRVEEPPAEWEKVVRTAVATCPTAAISIVDAPQ
jgi:ferredoxin